jgi:hypothetical protein
LNAAEFTAILSAPFWSSTRTSSMLATPPPTVNGILITPAIFLARSASVLRFSLVAVMSKKTSSSMPAAA